MLTLLEMIYSGILRKEMVLQMLFLTIEAHVFVMPRVYPPNTHSIVYHATAILDAMLLFICGFMPFDF